MKRSQSGGASALRHSCWADNEIEAEFGTGLYCTEQHVDLQLR
jgi:hypothetical protein